MDADEKRHKRDELNVLKDIRTELKGIGRTLLENSKSPSTFNITNTAPVRPDVHRARFVRRATGTSLVVDCTGEASNPPDIFTFADAYVTCPACKTQ